MTRAKPSKFDGSAIIVTIVCLMVQSVYLAEARNDPSLTVPIIDASIYHQAAVRFAGGEPLYDGAFWQPPLFPLFLGCIYQICRREHRGCQDCTGLYSNSLLSTGMVDRA